MQYVRESPLAKSDGWARQTVEGLDLGQVLTSLEERLSEKADREIEPTSKLIKDAVEAALSPLIASMGHAGGSTPLPDDLDSMVGSLLHPLPMATSSGSSLVHVRCRVSKGKGTYSQHGIIHVAADSMSAYCGWWYHGNPAAEVVDEPDIRVTCKRCASKFS